MRPAQSWEQLRKKRQEELQVQRLLLGEWGSNQVDAYVLNDRELSGIWVNLQKASGKSEAEIASNYHDLTGFALDQIRNHTSTVMSAAVLAKLGADMHRSGNMFGTYRLIQRSGKALIVFSGWPGLRRHLNAPVYGLTHPKVVKMGVGKAAAGSMLRSGVMFTFILSPTIRTIEWLFVDEKATLEQVFARVSTDIVKGLISAAAGYFAGAAITAIGIATTGAIVAIAPLGLAIGVAIVVGLGLDALDNRYGITEKLSLALAQHFDEWKQTSVKVRRESQHYFGTPRGQMEFIQRFLR